MPKAAIHVRLTALKKPRPHLHTTSYNWVGERNTYLIWLSLLVLTLALSACGFRLRGSVVLPEQMQSTYISGTDEFSELAVQLRNSLKSSGAELVRSLDVASAHLLILEDVMKRRVLTVDSQGRASEFELNYVVRFKVIDREDTLLVPEQQISLVRDLRFDINNVLAKDQEEQQLRRELVRFAVRQMMQRINAIFKSSAAG